MAEDNEWIDVRDRMPQETDADWTRRVLVWHVLNGCMLIGWHMVTGNRFISHWKKVPEGPEGYRKLHRDAMSGADERFV